LIAEELAFANFLSEHGLTVRAEDFALIGEITTPEFAPARFATTFFVAHLPTGQGTDVWPGELERGEWVDVQELLARWRRGDLLTPPSVMTLQAFGHRPVDDAPEALGPILRRLADGAMHPIYFAPCVQMIPLKTVALPPSTHTNAYFVGNGPRYLIDPGASDADEQARLFQVLDEEQPLSAILLTHHHPDHVGAAAICRERYGVPIWAHPRTAQLLEGRVHVDRMLDDTPLSLGPHPADGGPWHLCPLHTPGHASGHLAFFDPFYGLLFAGDMISTATSIVIAPPDGDLAVYLQSLQELRKLPARLLLPAHGNVSAQPTAVIDTALEHRAKRERQLVDALGEGPAAIDELTQRLYRGTPESLMRFARAQVLAGLLKLQGEGRALSLGGDRWQLEAGASLCAKPPSEH
jgi:ribonuclease/clavin/mitogillin